MKTFLAAFFSAMIFGLGLGISGMTLPSNVVAFLDVFGDWNPKLMFVMGSAVLVHAISYRLITKRKSPVLEPDFKIPTRKDIDWRLVIGSAIFGVGWGLGGFCPGPALVGLVTGQMEVIAFVLSMVLGILIYNRSNFKKG